MSDSLFEHHKCFPTETVQIEGSVPTSQTASSVIGRQYDHLAEEDEKILEEERESPRAAITSPVDPHGDYPDGGLRAWLVVLGSLCGTMSTFGFVNAWGSFQSYYQSVLLKDTSPSTIAWIGSIQYSLVFVPGLITGRLFDLGIFRLPVALASVTLVVSTILTAQCTQYWHFLLCQGVAVGLSCGIVFGPTIAVVSHWFKRRRGLALGILACGSSIGGTIFPIVFQNLVGQVGFKWTMRILGFILLFTTGVANLCMARRLPPVNISGGLLNLKAFRNIPYTLYSLSGFITFLGLYTVLTYIEVSAVAKGVPDSFAFYLVSIANASSALGRIGAGIIADKIGAINIMAPATALAGILTFVWPFVNSQGGYIALAIFYGISSGAFVSLLAAPMIAFGEPGDVGRRVGMCLTILAIGALIGPPISGAIISAHGYIADGIYAGVAVLLSVVIMWLAKCFQLQRFWGMF